MTDWLSPDEWRAVALSLRVSLWAVAASLPFGILTAYALARWEFRGKQVLNGIVHLPLILPPVVTGYLLLLTFGRKARWARSSTSGSASCWPSAGPARHWPPP
jgi:molybdate transport system permease protein